ncbi:MAG: hypothetical protein B7Z63_06835 [Ignavibacteriae bacterium 37-53-5]|nr:MAG: hypothetical protein B7Z63_06835 [Ignavibacteriae bacterium 37-53-5]
MSGEIVDLPVVEGQMVTKGQVLVKIRPDQYVAQLQQSEALLQSQVGGEQLAKANYDNSSSTYKRAEELHKKNLMSDQDLETAKTQYQVTKAQYESAKANVAQAQAQVAVNQDALNKTVIHAPMDGIVSVLNSKLGERVLGTSFTTGTEIMDIADMHSLEAQVDVDENDVILVAVGDTAVLSVDAFPNKKIKGLVYQIATSGTTTGVTIRTPKMPEGAKPENINMKGQATREKAQEVVFAVKNGVAHTAVVKRGISDDNYVEITSGLDAGQEVVSGSFVAISRELNDGSKVRVENNKMVATQAVGGGS